LLYDQNQALIFLESLKDAIMARTSLDSDYVRNGAIIPADDDTSITVEFSLVFKEISAGQPGEITAGLVDELIDGSGSEKSDLPNLKKSIADELAAYGFSADLISLAGTWSVDGSHLLHRRRIHRRLSSRGLLHLRRRFLRRYRSTSFQISHPHLQLRRRFRRRSLHPLIC
jgi:hypothetical protein